MEAVAGLDIGSSRIVAAVAVPAAGAVIREPVYTSQGDPVAGRIKIETAGTMGMRKGQVTDVSALSRSVREALSRVESAAGTRVEAVYAGIPGHTIEFCKNRYSSLIGKRRINHQDIERIRRLAMISDLPPGRRIVQAVPLEYMVDGTPVTGDPLGMYCTRLELECLAVTADSLLVDCLVEALHGAGVGVRDFIPSSLAAGEVLLTKAQQQLGTALVDIGGSCTCVLVYNHGYPAGFEALPVGSDHITSDLAICLRTTLAGAEEVKRSIGLGIGKPDGAVSGENPESITIPRMSGSGFNEVSIKAAIEIIEARISEILDLAVSSAGRMTGGIELPGGLVLAGGGSALKGLDTFSPEHLGIKVQMGCAKEDKEEVSRPGFSVAGAVGLVKYGIRHCQVNEAVYQPPQGFLNRIRELFRVSGKTGS